MVCVRASVRPRPLAAFAFTFAFADADVAVDGVTIDDATAESIVSASAIDDDDLSYIDRLVFVLLLFKKKQPVK